MENENGNYYFNFNQICRFCLSQGRVMSAIFDDSDNYCGVPLAYKILASISMQVFVGDGLPALICDKCLHEVERSFEFKTQCENSYTILRHYISNPKNGSKELGEVQFARSNMERSLSSALPFPNKVITFNENELNINPNEIMSEVIAVDPVNGGVDLEDEVPPTGSDAAGKELYGNSHLNALVCNNDKIFMQSKNNMHSLQNVGKVRPFKCPLCIKAFAQKAHLTRHSLVHSGHKPFSCTECEKSFADLSTMTTHLRTHSGERPFTCSLCDKTFMRRSDQRKHAVVHSGERPFVCPVCTKSFTRSTNLRKHMKIHSGLKPFVCPQCPKSFSTRGDVTRHQLIHTGQKPFSCCVCGMSFSRRDKLGRHEKTHGIDELAVPSSDVGPDNVPEDAEGDRETNLAEEVTVTDMKMELGDKLDKAEPRIDETESESSPQLEGEPKAQDGDEEKTGIINSPIPPLPRNHICGKCNKGFFRRRELLRHEKVHSGDRPFACQDCPKAFSRRDKLTRHARVHETSRMHVCSRCPASFLRGFELARHSKSHCANRQWACKTCNKAFYSRAELNRHEKTHAPVKPFACDLCHMSFCRRDKLTRHRKTHFGIKSFKCPTCGAAFTRNDNLVKHMLTHVGLPTYGETPSLVKHRRPKYLGTPHLVKHVLAQDREDYAVPPYRKSSGRYENSTARGAKDDAALASLDPNPGMLLCPITNQ